jgi:hypothetical protein
MICNVYLVLHGLLNTRHPSHLDVFTPGNLVEGQYQYMNDLQALQATAAGLGPHYFNPMTPLARQAWQQALVGHPDKEFVVYIL